MEGHSLAVRYREESMLWLWLGNDDDRPDRVALRGGQICCYPDLDSLRADALARGAEEVAEESVDAFDLDRVAAWCADPRPEGDLSLLLDFWNLLEDLTLASPALAQTYREQAEEYLDLHARLTQRALPDLLGVPERELDSADYEALGAILSWGLEVVDQLLGNF